MTFVGTAKDQVPPREEDRPPRREEGPRGPGGPHLLPPIAMEALDLTPSQQQQLKRLENDSRTKLEKILTPEQAERLNNLRSARGGGMEIRREVTRNPRTGPPERPDDGERRPEVPSIAETIDLNHDGIIDSSEIKKASQSLLKRDKNGDGTITPDEYRGPQFIERRIEIRDGKTTTEEYRGSRPRGLEGEGQEGRGPGRPRGDQQGRPQRPQE